MLKSFVFAALIAAVSAIPAAQPQITPPPSLPLDRRDILDSASYVSSVLGGLGSSVSAFVASGVPQYFNDLPTGTAVLSSVGVSKTDLAAVPTQALLVPPYANWTDKGWNVRVHGNIFKQPNISTQKLNDLANKFLIGTDITSLPQDQQNQARNLTAEIYIVQQDNEQVVVNFVSGATVTPENDSGAIAAKGGDQTIKLTQNTTEQGDFDEFVVLKDEAGVLLAGNATKDVQVLDLYVQGAETTGNATAWLVPNEGLTIVSDIDDILRVTKIYKPKEGLLNSFARPFTAWLNMPDIYSHWAKTIDGAHFHYLTTTPEQVTKNYMEFIYKTYPLGSFDTRPLNFSDASATLRIREFLLRKVIETFPTRKFVLVGDTSNSDIMRDYPLMATDYPSQIQCILLRNTTATDSDDQFPYDTSGFKDVDKKKYMFFLQPTDLAFVNLGEGGCVNDAIVQNVTFKTQGLPFGIGNAAGRGRSSVVGGGVLGSVAWVAMVVLIGTVFSM